MKKIASILFLGFLISNLASCKTVKDKVIFEPNPNAPKVEFVLGQSSFPKLSKNLSDYELNFSAEELEKLTTIIREFKQITSQQIAIVSIKSNGQDINFDKSALNLSNSLGVGRRNMNHGLTIVVSKNLKRIRILTGKRTEKILTNEICKTIIDEIIIPEFEKGDYYNGIEKGLLKLIYYWI